jgi:hypothetical protein
VVDALDDSGRQILVATDEGELITFVLNRATGSFISDDQSVRARLTFV